MDTFQYAEETGAPSEGQRERDSEGRLWEGLVTFWSTLNAAKDSSSCIAVTSLAVSNAWHLLGGGGGAGGGRYQHGCGGISSIYLHVSSPIAQHWCN